jgi:hypothetical protein
MTPIELLGWISTIVTLSSFLFDGVKMRVVNSVGCMGWALWGYYNDEVSVMTLNGIIILVHLIKLIRGQRLKALEMERKEQLSIKRDTFKN